MKPKSPILVLFICTNLYDVHKVIPIEFGLRFRVFPFTAAYKLYKSVIP